MHFRPRVCVDCLRVSFGRIACKWLFCLCKIAWKNMMEFGRGGACVPARVALQGRIHRSIPAHYACILGMETPLRGRSGGHTGTAPTVSFGQIARGTVGVVWVDCVWTVGFVWVDCVCGFVCWLVKTVHMNQHHRCCTFDSPGLPTKGGYPG